MKKILALVLVLVLALSLVACGGGKDDEITIAVIGQQTGNVVFLPAQEGALKAGEDLGITVEWQSPIRAEAELQNEIMNNLIDLGLEDDPAFGCPFINTGVQIATIDDYKEVMGLE